MLLNHAELLILQRGLQGLLTEKREGAIPDRATIHALKIRIDREVVDTSLLASTKLNRDEEDGLWA
jgi:hypothetical protein